MQAPSKVRSRAAIRTRSQSDSEMDEDVPVPPQPPLVASTPQSPLGAPPPGARTEALDQAARETHQQEMAEWVIYDLMRMCASAARALALYDCKGCLEELEKLPRNHQRSAWVMAMVGKAHYELSEYSAVSVS